VLTVRALKKKERLRLALSCELALLSQQIGSGSEAESVRVNGSGDIGTQTLLLVFETWGIRNA
jgi:hypothetical protein